MTLRALARGAALLIAIVACSVAAARESGAHALRIGWSPEEIAVLASMQLVRLPSTVDRSNAVESTPAAVALGRRLFEDRRFSANQSVACATCHVSERQFQDGLPVGKGIGQGSRRTMPIVDAAYGPWFFWDGRKDSLWSQALAPLEDPAEHGGNRTRFVHLLRAHYARAYEAVFGPLPDPSGLPADAGPLGTVPERAAWAAMDGHAREAVNRVFANLGKAIAAYERTLAYAPSRFDRYVAAVVAGDAKADHILTRREVNGLRLFIGKAQCATCHSGPLLTDHVFHNTGVPPRVGQAPDPGRANAIARVLADEFNCLGPYSDTRDTGCDELRFIAGDGPALLGAFKTPGLRGVAQRPPYMHAGQFTTLEQVVQHYITAPRAAVGTSELAANARADTDAHRRPIRLTPAEVRDLVSFLGVLSGKVVQRPAP